MSPPAQARSFPNLLIGAALAVCLPVLLSGLFGAEFLATEGSRLGGLGLLLYVAVVGRVLLALLPAGSPGEFHLGARDSGGLLATWATSHLAGVILLSGESLLLSSLGYDFGVWGLGLPWLLFGLFVYLTGPGDLVPRHARLVEPAHSPLARLLALLATLICLLPLLVWLRGGALLLHGPDGGFLGLSPGAASAPLSGAAPTQHAALVLGSFPALAILAHHALVAAGTGATRRLGWVLVLLSLPAPFALFASSASGPTAAALPHAVLAATACAAFGAIWLIRADRRAAYLAILAGLSLAWLTPGELAPVAPALVTAALLTLFFATPAPGRQRLVTPLVLALVLGLAVGFTLALHATGLQAIPEDATALLDPARALTASYDPRLFGITFMLVDAAWLVLLFRRPWRGDRIRPRPELFFAFLLATSLFVFSTSAILGHQGLWPRTAGAWRNAAPSLLALLAPSAILMLALSADELLPGLTRRRRGL